MITESANITAPEDVGLLPAQLSNVDAIVESSMASKVFKGAVVLIARHGEICYLKAFGQADDHKPMKPDTIFRWASMSKLFCAVAVLQLYEQGKLLLSDPVSKYLPELKDLQVIVEKEGGGYELVPAKRDITLHHLMSMTSGLGGSFSFEDELHLHVGQLFVERGVVDTMMPLDMTVAEFVNEQIPKVPLVSHPGEGWEYSNVGVLALSRVVEVVSGMALDDYYRKFIWKPLGMNETWFFPPEEVWSRMPAVYQAHTLERLSGIVGPDDTDLPFSQNKKFLNTAGGLMGATTDYYKLAQMLLNKGELNGAHILSPRSVMLMTSNEIGALVDDFFQNKWGYMVDIQADLNALGFNWGDQGAYGWHGYWGTAVSVNPKDDTVVIFMTSTNLWPDLWDTEQKVLAATAAAVAA